MKTYTFTEEELFDLLECADNASTCATIGMLINGYLDERIAVELFQSVLADGNRLMKKMPNKSRELIDAFNKKRGREERSE